MNTAPISQETIQVKNIFKCWCKNNRPQSWAARLVWNAVALHANEQGVCQISMSMLVGHTELSAGNIRKHLSRMIDKGLISIPPDAMRGKLLKENITIKLKITGELNE